MTMARITRSAHAPGCGAVLESLAERGLQMRSGFEYEFFVFRETPHSVREKGLP